MSDFQDKKNLIINQENKIAQKIASQVIDKPKLSVWMILIPIIFVYYFIQLSQYDKGKKKYAENYMVAFRRALEAAYFLAETDAKPKYDELAEKYNIPKAAKQQQIELFKILTDHYLTLLQAKGEDVLSLIKSGYGSKKNILDFFNRLSHAERKLNLALKDHLEQSDEVIDQVISKIDSCSKQTRFEFADTIFAS